MILFGVGDAHARSLAKAVTWRLAASVDTLFISYLITGRITQAGTIAGAEVQSWWQRISSSGAALL
jgi:hypothetical protein